MRKKICGAVAALAFLWLLGIAGSGDLGCNTIKDIIIQGSAALAIFAGSLYAGGFIETGSSQRRRR